VRFRQSPPRPGDLGPRACRAELRDERPVQHRETLPPRISLDKRPDEISCAVARISERLTTSDESSALPIPRIARTPDGLTKTCKPKASLSCRTIAGASCRPLTSAVNAAGRWVELGIFITSIGRPRLIIRSTSLEGSPK
jgi:hypothetical protein